MYTLGIDIGSTATKAVVLKNGKDIYASAIISFGAGTSGTCLLYTSDAADD